MQDQNLKINCNKKKKKKKNVFNYERERERERNLFIMRERNLLEESVHYEREESVGGIYSL